MGFLFSRFMDRFTQKKGEITILGVECAGKTTLIKYLDTSKFERTTLPTVGFNIFTIKRGNMKLNVWDLQGQKNFRPQWIRYLSSADIVIYMIDIADPSRYEESITELIKILPKIPYTCSLLILLNKIDLLENIDPQFIIKQIAEKIRSSEEAKNHIERIGNFHNISISLKNGTNVKSMLEWLDKEIDKKHD